MDGPHHGLKIYTSPQSGRTPPWAKNLEVHEVNGPYHGLKIHKFTKRTDPTKNLQAHEVDGPHHGLKS